ncbi:MAG: DNA-binding protein [Spirochaetaceae bacterium]|nr:DNA-binding protein [Spirochaetaceae bacterium]
MIDFSMYDVKEPTIEAWKCESCGEIFYPAPMICSKCGVRRDPVTNKGWSTFEMEGPCTLLTWTRVWNLPEGYNKKFLQFGIVEFENGLRASGRVEVEKPETGMKLTTTVEESDERPGDPVNVFVFK